MTYACFKDLLLYEKLKLADQAALDGAISKIRVWKLGKLGAQVGPHLYSGFGFGRNFGNQRRRRYD